MANASKRAKGTKREFTWLQNLWFCITIKRLFVTAIQQLKD